VAKVVIIYFLKQSFFNDTGLLGTSILNKVAFPGWLNNADSLIVLPV